MTTEAELMPCPFCGERAALQVGHHSQYVMCLSCEVMGPNLRDRAEAIAAWNRRTLPAQAQASVWKDIRSAPKEGFFLAAIKHGGRHIVVHAQRRKTGVFDTQENSSIGYLFDYPKSRAWWTELPAPPGDAMGEESVTK